MNLKAFVRSVDWPRVIHMAATFARALSEDPDLASDDQRARASAEKFRKLGERIARQSVGCTGGTGCACPVCQEMGRP